MKPGIIRLAIAVALVDACWAGSIRKDVLLPPGPGNPRNSEGDFIRLNSGRIHFVYTHFTGNGGDHGSAFLASRYSDDDGRTWSQQDQTVVTNEGGFNVMSVSLLRLRDDRIALFYLRKNSVTDCRPVMRVSTNEADSWSGPREVITDQVGYYVMNNDRVVQLQSGRLVCPVAFHNAPGFARPDWNGRLRCYLSDDGGGTWRRGSSELIGRRADGRRVALQEPGVVELTDGRLLMWARTGDGTQYQSWSDDGGDHWSPARPGNIVSPKSPATIERIPGTGDLLLAWNDHTDIARRLKGKRTPFTVAISGDDGATWERRKVLEDDPDGWYCYTAMDFVAGRVLLGHCAGDRRQGGLNTTQITSFPIAWLYGR